MGWQQSMKLGHLHSSLIGIVRDSLKTASTATLYVCSANWSSDTGMLIPVCLQSLDYAYLGEMRWYTWYTSGGQAGQAGQLRREEEKKIKKCRSAMDIDYIFWCQVAILEVQYYM